MESVEPFDLSRMLWGDRAGPLFLLEVAVRTSVMYVYAIVFARGIGQRGVGGISAFELVLIVVIGSAAGDPMFCPDVPLLHGMVVLTIVIGLHRILGLLTGKSRGMETAVEGSPVVVVRDGHLVEEAITSGSLSKSELMSQLNCGNDAFDTRMHETSGRSAHRAASPSAATGVLREIAALEPAVLAVEQVVRGGRLGA